MPCKKATDGEITPDILKTNEEEGEESEKITVEGGESKKSIEKGGESIEVKLGPGIVLIKRFADIERQKNLLRQISSLKSGFFVCDNEKTKNMRMMNLGMNTVGKKAIIPVPREFEAMAISANTKAQELASIPHIIPNQVVINEYIETSALKLHDDVLTSTNCRVPVVSISLGASACFIWKASWKKSEVLKSVVLESGDALVFGGKSRGILHGIDKIIANSCPRELEADVASASGTGRRGGVRSTRFNINCRQF